MTWASHGEQCPFTDKFFKTLQLTLVKNNFLENEFFYIHMFKICLIYGQTKITFDLEKNSLFLLNKIDLNQTEFFLSRIKFFLSVYETN